MPLPPHGRYGEVFLQLRLSAGIADAIGVSQDHIVTGDVIVARNPCLHPGDILCLRAVDNPACHHLHNCEDEQDRAWSPRGQPSVSH